MGSRRRAAYLCAVDRSYSQFPAGSVGAALLLLRLVDALGLVAESARLFVPANTSSAETVALILGIVLIGSAIMLTLGLRTPLAGAAAAVATIGSAVDAGLYMDQSQGEPTAWLFMFVLVFAMSSALALTGPGGYSLDARLSGWKRITLSSGTGRGSSTIEKGRER